MTAPVHVDESEPGASQRLAFDEFADDEALADVVHRNDVGVAQGGDGAGLDLEPLTAGREFDA